MKFPLFLAVATAFSIVSVRADDTIKAAVVARQVNVEVKEAQTIQMGGRRTFEMGEVYEVGTQTPGRLTELKVGASQVALVPPDAIKVRTCTPAELSEAQTKFNSVLSAEAQKANRKKSADDLKSAQSHSFSQQPNSTTGSSNTRTGSSAFGTSLAQRQKDQKKNERETREALVKEALAWGAAGPAQAK